MKFLIAIITGFFVLEAHSSDFFNSDFKEKNVDRVTVKLTDDTSLSLFAAATASVMFTQPYDIEARNAWKNNQQMSKAESSFGDFLGSGFASALIVGGQYLFDDNRENWQTHARSLVWEAGAVTVLKYSFGKQRPGNRDSYVSFPSGHTSTAFATATVLADTYGWQAGLVAFPIATFVGLSRMSDDMHWISDVVGGAFLGVIVARACLPDKNIKNANYFWYPSYADGEFSVSAKMMF